MSIMTSESIMFDVRPQVLNVKLASLIGLEASTIVQQLHYWLEVNKKADKNFHDGRYWTYGSLQEYRDRDFPYFSTDQLWRIIKKLVKSGIIIKGNYNKHKMDKRLWYTIDYATISALVDETLNGKLAGYDADANAKAKETPDNDDKTHDDQDHAAKDGQEQQEQKEQSDSAIPRDDSAIPQGDSAIPRDDFANSRDAVREFTGCISQFCKNQGVCKPPIMRGTDTSKETKQITKQESNIYISCPNTPTTPEKTGKTGIGNTGSTGTGDTENMPTSRATEEKTSKNAGNSSNSSNSSASSANTGNTGTTGAVGLSAKAVATGILGLSVPTAAMVATGAVGLSATAVATGTAGLLAAAVATGETGITGVSANRVKPVKKPAKASKTTMSEESKELFTAFWALYPRKVSKEESLEAWISLNPDKELFERMCEAIKCQKKTPQWSQDNGRFIPYPVTWLNKKRWEDETASCDGSSGNSSDGGGGYADAGQGQFRHIHAPAVSANKGFTNALDEPWF